MSHFSEHFEIYDRPIILTAEEQQDPFLILHEFFLDYHLSQLRMILQEVGDACLSTDTPPFDTDNGRADLIYFRHKTEELFEAVFLIAKRNQANRKEE